MTAPPAPTISVILPVHNGAAFLRAALDSIFAQTFQGFECLVVDDGSTDDTATILRDCRDSRLVVLTQPNLGLTRSLNRALALARGEFVARQDADDLSTPERFEKQFAFLRARPTVALVGSGVRVIDEHGQTVREHLYPTEPAEICEALQQRFNPLPHSSVMFRREVVSALGGWDERFVKAQDFELYLRLCEKHQLASLPEPLVFLRYRPGSLFSTGESGEQLKYALLASALAAFRLNHPERNLASNAPLPLEQFEAWYQASPYPAHFAAGVQRREAQLAWRQHRWLAAGRALGMSALADPSHVFRRLLRLPDRSMIELAREFERWMQA